MKKKIAMLLAAALCMGTFAGCGNSTSNNSSSAADNNTTDNTAAATENSDATASADNVKIDTLNVYSLKGCRKAGFPALQQPSCCPSYCLLLFRCYCPLPVKRSSND